MRRYQLQAPLPIDNYNIKPIAEIPFWKDPVFYALTGASGIAVAIYAYCTRFNLKDAHALMDSIHEYLETTRTTYNHELALLANNSDQTEQQKKLNSIILEFVSPTPYIDYVTKTADCLDQCKAFLKKIENGTPKLKTAYLDLLNKTNSSSQSDSFALKLQDYESTIKKLEDLEVELSELMIPLGSLCKFCWQSEAYKQEMVYAELQKLNRNLESVGDEVLINSIMARVIYDSM